MVAKYGLLIGVTYPGTDAYLPGCDNDILEIYKFLKQRGYNDFEVLCDTDVFDTVRFSALKPSASNIVQSFFRLIEWTRENPDGHVFLHYSGHGTQVADSSWVFDETKKIWCGEEEDGKDECIVTQDLQLISDDQLHWLFRQMPSTIKLFSLMDSCHSGSAFDLKYYMKSATESMTVTSVPDLEADIFMLSGCRDDQYGQSYMFGSKWYGVMTYAFLYLMNYMSKYNVNEFALGDIWKYMGMICSNFPQVPQASFSKNKFSKSKLRCSSTEFELYVEPDPEPQSGANVATRTHIARAVVEKNEKVQKVVKFFYPSRCRISNKRWSM